MTNTIDTWINSPAMAAFLRDVSAEARAGQRQAPDSGFAIDRCVWSARDLQWAMIHNAAGYVPDARVYANAVRLAASAARLALGGDEGRPYAFAMALHETFAVSVDLAAPTPPPAVADTRSALETKW